MKRISSKIYLLFTVMWILVFFVMFILFFHTDKSKRSSAFLFVLIELLFIGIIFLHFKFVDLYVGNENSYVIKHFGNIIRFDEITTLKAIPLAMLYNSFQAFTVCYIIYISENKKHFNLVAFSGKNGNYINQIKNDIKSHLL